MPELQISLTVFFKDSFWVGIFERTDGDKLSVSRVTFAAEPKDYQVYDFILKHYLELNFSPSVENAARSLPKLNPKRMQREAHRQMSQIGLGTKAQQALKLQQEQNKISRKVRNKEQTEADKLKRFKLKQAKKQERHRGH